MDNKPVKKIKAICRKWNYMYILVNIIPSTWNI